jgi:hypothetical protein
MTAEEYLQSKGIEKQELIFAPKGFAGMTELDLLELMEEYAEMRVKSALTDVRCSCDRNRVTGR